MRRILIGTALAGLLGVGATAHPASAVNTVHATSSVELTADLGYQGMYKYTIDVDWDLDESAVGHLTLFLRLDALADTCEVGDVLFPTPGGTSSGTDNGAPCQVVYDGLFLCKTDPSLGLEDPSLSVKFQPVSGSCQTTTQGNGTFIFYTHVPPDIPGTHEEAVAVKHGEYITLGTIEGALPGTAGQRELGIALINEFLVKPRPGDSEFIEIVASDGEELDLTGWYLEIDGELQIPLGGELNPNEFQVIQEPVPPNTVIADFDNDPFGAPIACGTPVSFSYYSQGFYMSALPSLMYGYTCSESNNVFANCGFSFPEGEGSSPNVISVCSGDYNPAFSEILDGTIRVDLCTPANRVCIDVFPDNPTAFGFIRAEALGDSVQGEIQSTPGINQTICFEFPGMTTFYFAGFGEHRAAFDNLMITFENEPGCEIIGKIGDTPLAFGTSAVQEEDEGFLSDQGGTIVLYDNYGLVQDQVAYGNEGGAPTSVPIIFPPGYPRPEIFLKSSGFGTSSAQEEPDTLSTSTQRVFDSQDTDNDAADFNVGSPSPFENNNQTVNGGGTVAGRDRGGQLGTSSVEGTALGSSVRINQVYVFAPGADNIEFYNPTSSLVDMAGWFFQGAFIEPIYDGGGSEPVAALDRTTLPQGYSSTFSFEIGYDDVIYLYQPDMVRVDQLGWTQTPFYFPDLCLIRTTDGVGPAECHDFNSCGGLTGTITYESCGLQSVTVGVEGGTFTTALAAPFPNPAFHQGTISFVVGGTEGVPSPVSLAVYDVAGRKLRTLARGPLAAGAYSISWDGRNDGGSAVGSGVYFVRLRVGSEPVQTRSVVWATR